MRAALLLSAADEGDLALALAWAEAGDDVTVVLLDSAAAAARAGHALGDASLRRLLDAGVSVLAHHDALRRRGLDGADVVDGLKAVDMDEIADLVAEGADRVVWL